MNRFDLSDETHFLNIDLDVFARRPLEPLAAAFGKSVHVLFVGGQGKRHEAHFEIADSFDESADVLIRRFVTLVTKLPSGPRKLWDEARSRDFNIGIQAAFAPFSHELRLRPETLEAVARVGGSVVITTYAPEDAPSAPVRGPADKGRGGGTRR